MSREIRGGMDKAKITESYHKDLRIGRGIFVYILILAPWFLIMIKLYGTEYIGHIWR